MAKGIFQTAIDEELEKIMPYLFGEKVSDNFDVLYQEFFNAIYDAYWLEMNLFGNVEVETEIKAAPEVITEKSELEQAREEADQKPEHGDAKPPHDGTCKNCGQKKPINRLRLCYKCWCELTIKDREKALGRDWKVGDPHPDWCNCEFLGEHRSADGSPRGLN